MDENNEDQLKTIHIESEKFHLYYMWLENSMPPLFFEEVKPEHILLCAHNLMGLQLQEYFCNIRLKQLAIVMCLDSPDADLRILKHFRMHGIKYYQTYLSNTPPPFPGVTSKLRIATIYFTEAIETVEIPYSDEAGNRLYEQAKARIPQLTWNEFDTLIASINTRFLRSLSDELIVSSLKMFFRAKSRDLCQYEERYNEDWKEKNKPSMQIVLAWGHTAKYNFLYKIAKVVHRHNLVMKRVNATYIHPYSKETCLIMALGLHGSDGRPAWEVCDIVDFLRELMTVKYFSAEDHINSIMVNNGYVSGNFGSLLRAMVAFAHQCLVHIDPNLYTIERVEEAICRHPELSSRLCEIFKWKFDPWNKDYRKYIESYEKLKYDVTRLDTGHEENDKRRKNVLLQCLNLIQHTLKTNFYRINYSALSFRLDPKYLDNIPFDRKEKFPELPYAVFFIKGMNYIGFHIRFKDLARGGLRTVIADTAEILIIERNNVFTECYNLAYTQQKKNKDIPEGGAKAIILINPNEQSDEEMGILMREFEAAKLDPEEIKAKMDKYSKENKDEYLFSAQRSFVDSLLTIVNFDYFGELRAKYIVDYLHKPEYLYLGPDENMYDRMIEWIAEWSRRHKYRPDTAFISGKPKAGINHKEYGVTSLGVNIYLDAVLRYLGIDPEKEPFTIKMTGGPDGDVAGNEIKNLYKYYPETAKILALTDGSGTINDPQGLNLEVLVELFKQGKAINHYPPELLTESGFLLDRLTKRSQTALVQQTLCWRKSDGKLIQDWLGGNDMNELFRHNVHRTKTDVFIPGGGRPRTLNQDNVNDFLDETGKPTSRAIIEGANLYLDNYARRFLEKLGVLIIKDSSANKTGVICSSFEILTGLALGDDLFEKNKETIVAQTLEKLRQCADNEAKLMLRTHAKEGLYLTDISELISERINQFVYQILDYLEDIDLPKNYDSPLIQCFLDYCLPIHRETYMRETLKYVPNEHKKAIIAAHLGAQVVYKKGLDWMPSIVDILPFLLENKVYKQYK